MFAKSFWPSLCLNTEEGPFDGHSPLVAIAPSKLTNQFTDQQSSAASLIELGDAYMTEIETFFESLSSNTSTPAPLAVAYDDFNDFFLSLVQEKCVDPAMLTDDPELLALLRPANGPSSSSSTATPSTMSGTSSRSSHIIDSRMRPISMSITTSTSASISTSTSISASASPSPNSRKTKPKFYSRSGQIADPTRGPCHNCKTTLTCYWRKLKGLYYCNACTLFYKRNKYHRSVEEVDRPIKRRNRRSKYSEK